MDRQKILVVDDEKQNAQTRKRLFTERRILRYWKQETEAKQWMSFLPDQDIALIILDVMMPKMDGWQVCREIRSYSKVPIIMLTARSDERDELQGFDLGVDEYISKPFSPKILVARVEAILRSTGKLLHRTMM